MEISSFLLVALLHTPLLFKVLLMLDSVSWRLSLLERPLSFWMLLLEWYLLVDYTWGGKQQPMISIICLTVFWCRPNSLGVVLAFTAWWASANPFLRSRIYSGCDARSCFEHLTFDSRPTHTWTSCKAMKPNPVSPWQVKIHYIFFHSRSALNAYVTNIFI